MDEVKLEPQDELQKTEFTLGGREYQIKVLPPLLAYRLFLQHVKPMLSAFVSSIDPQNPKPMSLVVMDAFGKLPYENLQALNKVYLERCIRCRNDGGQWESFASNPDRYFQDMNPSDLLMLDLRCAAVNFGRFVSTLEKDLAAVGINLAEEPQEEEPNSSPISSEQGLTPDTTPLEI